MGVSILILTLNEEANLPACLESVKWSDDVVVFDSFSTDRTVEIAKEFGARVVQRKFDNYASQRNYGLNEISYKHPWVLMLDADETTPEDLVAEMKNVVASCSEAVTLYRMRRKDMFMGRWIRRSSGYPTWFGRLARVGKVRVSREVNEEYDTDGEIRLLQGHLIHYPFNKGFHAWFDKHNRYSTMEARLLAEDGQERVGVAQLFAQDPQSRRKALKQFGYALAARPFVMFCVLYFARGGILEGRAGLTFCLLRAFYEFMIDCKVREAHRRRQGLSL